MTCETVHARGEELGRNGKYREKYGLSVARAVAALNVLCEYCLPFVEVGGVFAALKGEKDEVKEAENAIKKLGGELAEVKSYALPSGDKRNLIIIRKVTAAPPQYPRASAKIAKKPL